MAISREESIEKRPLVGDVDEDVSMLNPNPTSQLQVPFSKSSRPPPIPTLVFAPRRRSPVSKKWVIIFSLILIAICIVITCIFVQLIHIYFARMSPGHHISDAARLTRTIYCFRFCLLLNLFSSFYISLIHLLY